MKRVVILACLVFLLGAVAQSFANFLPSWLNLFLPPVILIFMLQYFRPLETIGGCLSVGGVLDVLSGMLLGSNMLFMLFAAFLMSSSNLFSCRIQRQELAFYIVATSFFYRVLALIVSLVILGSKSNMHFLQLFMGPVVDGVVGVVIIRFFLKTMAFFKTIDENDVQTRLGYRG